MIGHTCQRLLTRWNWSRFENGGMTPLPDRTAVSHRALIGKVADLVARKGERRDQDQDNDQRLGETSERYQGGQGGHSVCPTCPDNRTGRIMPG